MVSRKSVELLPPPGEAAARPKPAKRLLLRPMARVEHISLFEQEVRDRLSRSALELVLAAAQVIAEGQRATRAGRESFFGSTMLTIDLGRVAPSVRDACDARSAQRLATLLAGDAGALARIRAIAARETERVAGS